MAKKTTERNIIESLEIAAQAAESFLKVYYKAKKELEGIYSPTPRKGLQQEMIDQVLNKHRINLHRSMARKSQGK